MSAVLGGSGEAAEQGCPAPGACQDPLTSPFLSRSRGGYSRERPRSLLVNSARWAGFHCIPAHGTHNPAKPGPNVQSSEHGKMLKKTQTKTSAVSSVTADTSPQQDLGLRSLRAAPQGCLCKARAARPRGSGTIDAVRGTGKRTRSSPAQRGELFQGSFGFSCCSLTRSLRDPREVTLHALLQIPPSEATQGPTSHTTLTLTRQKTPQLPRYSLQQT